VRDAGWWLECDAPETMLNRLREASQRKLRLYGAACCRRITDLLGPGARRAIEAAERFAAGAITAAELKTIRQQALARPGTPKGEDIPQLARQEALAAVGHVSQVGKQTCWGSVRLAARSAVEAVAHGPTWAAAAISDRVDVCDRLRQGERRAQADLLRDIFPNPFSPPITPDPAWQTPLILDLARRITDEGDIAGLPILADALEEAGCDNHEILDHLRSPGPHVRGCRAVDLILGKN